MKIHQLKCDYKYFESMLLGKKTFEIRKNDRDFQVGDRLCLMEMWQGSESGRWIEVDVVYMTDYEQKEGFVVLGIERFRCAWKDRPSS